MFSTPLRLEGLSEPDEWAVLAPVVWLEGQLRIEVPAGFVTDLASIPRELRGMFDVNGPARRPGVLHDFLYCARHISRLEADELLYRALVAEGMSEFTAKFYFFGVRAGGQVHWDTRAPGLHRGDFVSDEAFAAATR